MMNYPRQIVRFLVIILTVFATTAVVAYDYSSDITNALNRHDTTEVLNLLEAANKLAPNYAPHYLLAGQIYFERKQFDKAMEQFDLVFKKKPNLPIVLYYEGLILLEQGKTDEAGKVFQQGLNKSKDEKAMFHNGLGLLHLQTKEYAKADVEFRKAIQIGPDLPEFHANLGDANYYAKIYPLAISEYNQVIAMDTGNLDVYFRLARAYVTQGQYNEALDQLRTVLIRDSLYSVAWKEIGKLYTLAGLSARDSQTKEQRFKESVGSYRKYLELSKDSSDGEVFFNLGRSYYYLGGYVDADLALQHVLALGITPQNIYLYLGQVNIGEEKFQTGIDYLNKHLENLSKGDSTWVPGQEDADAYRRIGDGYRALQDFNNAADYYAKAFLLDSTNARLAVDAALAFHQIKDYQQALKYYEKRISLGPDSWNIFLNAAFCTLNMSDYQKSVEYLNKVVALDSTNVKALGLLSTTYVFQLRDCENGAAATKRLLDIDNTNCDGLRTMGFIYFGGICSPNYLQAINYFGRALSCYQTKGTGNCSVSDLVLYLAQANHLYAAQLANNKQKQESKKYFKEAFDLYNRVLKCDPGNADAKKGVQDTEFEF